MALRSKPPAVPASAKRPEPDDAAFERVMSKAPDHRPETAPAPEPRKPKGVAMGNRRQITLTLMDGKIEAVDTMAQRMGMSRAAYINYAISQQLVRDGER